ncbi:MAG: HAD family hydrolase [Candidatus Pacebacteria bacterium]|nr:HAD family hydrolase [Candidatus Paceibacterota bacterium]
MIRDYSEDDTSETLVLPDEDSSKACSKTTAESPFEHELDLIAQLVPPSLEDLKSKEVRLGLRTRKHTLVLDIDNTLVFSQPSKASSAATDTSSVDVTVRPYAIKLIERLHSLYEIVLFTAGCDAYAAKIRKHLDPSGKRIVRSLGNSSCITTKEGLLVKDLRIFVDRPLQNILIADDRVTSFAFQLDNGVPVAPYFGADDDDELSLLADYLQDLYEADDIASANAAQIRISTK